ncbi:MAG: STAS-like domain-containing protein [Nitrospinae bacterium]|nr:STAS-like domain-containing protein [Nitrospinota bacterium]MBL7019655.1 STAS-like domain-containing protein [Nitrospinaceae bacterium]
MKIRISEHVGTHCASIDDGQKLYRILAPEFQKGNSVELDFGEVQSILTPFLHNCIGRLLSEYQKETVMERLVLCNLSPEHLQLLNLYIDRKDEEQFQDDSRNSLRELFEEDELGDSGL